MKYSLIYSSYLISILIQFVIGGKSNDDKELAHKAKRNRGKGTGDYEGDYENVQFINMVANSLETIPWGIGESLQDIKFWDTILPPDSSDGIKICIIGSGYDIEHPDLPKAPDVIGSAPTGESWSVDTAGHGTHLAGIISAIGNNDEGVVGIFPNNKGENFQLVIGKTSMGSSDNKAPLSSHMDAVNRCVNEGAKVIATPMGNECFSQRESKYFNKLYDQGILVFAPAGDDGDETYTYPASLPSVVSVASSNRQREWDGSQMNNQVELTAPGINIMSTLPNNQYASWDGTAMATAHAAGVAGLLWMHFPSCTNVQIRNVLAKTSLDIGTTGCDDKFGHGLIQAKDAYDLLSDGNCGGDIGSTDPVGGCHQLNSPVLSDSCTVDNDCDDGDLCTVDTCKNDFCSYDYDCVQCGLDNLVTVDIMTDKYPEETTWEVIDYATKEMVMSKNTSSYGNCDRLYSKSQCLSEGGYLFVIYDSELDGLCCEYGRGRYEVAVGGERKVLGGEFEDTKSHFFHVKSNEPTTSPKPTTPKPPITSPTTAVPTETWSPTTSPTDSHAPTTLACTSNVDCDDGDDCTDDTCVASKCNFELNCASCELPEKVTVDILTDRSPGETTWEITDYYTYEQYMKSSSYGISDHAYSSSKCFGSGSYVFSIYDSSDDGICCLYGQGKYTVSIGNKNLAAGGQFKSVEMHLFSIDDSIPTTDPRNPIPTWAPTATDYPTLSPTTTRVPTDAPSFSPSTSPSTSLMPSSTPSNLPSLTPTSSLQPSAAPSSNPTETCARVYEEAKECKLTLSDDGPNKCCKGLACWHNHCFPDCAIEGMMSKECGATGTGANVKESCCKGRTCGENGRCEYPDGCAPLNGWAKECNFPKANVEKCCDGLVCKENKCVDWTPCAREGENSKECDSEFSVNTECCEGYTCGDVGGETNVCIKDPDVKCGAVGKLSMDCGAPGDSTRNIVCCEGFVCVEGSDRCKNAIAKKNQPAIECGDPDAASASCGSEQYCDPTPGSFICIKPCAREGENSKECGSEFSDNSECCEGYTCGDAGGASNVCIKDPDVKCGAVGKLSMECGAPGDSTRNIVCCEGFVCVEGSDRCKNAIAKKNQPAIECGDPNAASVSCGSELYCDPTPGSFICIKPLPCAKAGKNTKECGAKYSNLGYCCPGFKCVGGKSKQCIVENSTSQLDTKPPCAEAGKNAKECGAKYSKFGNCCPGYECVVGNSNKCIAS